MVEIYGAFTCGSCVRFGILGEDHRERKFTAHRKFGDRRDGVTSARTYFYADEVKCDQHMETFLNCIKASGETRTVRLSKKVVRLLSFFLSLF